MPNSTSFLKQMTSKEAWKSTSKRWASGGGGGATLKQMEGLQNMYNSNNNKNMNGCGEMFVVKKRVMVVVDNSSHSKHAMMWALTHVANKGDILTLLHVLSPSSCQASDSNTAALATSLGSLCKACKPEVEVEALVIQGPKMATVVSQVKKLEVSVLVLGQKKASSFLKCLCLKSSSEEFVEQCINNLECLTIGVTKQSRGVSGYLISTRWHKNFWLLA